MIAHRMPSIIALAVLVAAAVASEHATAAVPARVADLDALVVLALERHPALGAWRAEAAAIREDARSRGALPEPMVTVSPVGDMAQTASGEVETMFGLSQRFPGWGKRGAMVAEREAEVGLAEAGARGEAVAIARDLRTAWWRLHEARAAAALVRAQQALLEELRATVTVRVEANLASSGKLLRLGVEIGRLDAVLSELDREAETALAVLRRTLSLDAGIAVPELRDEPSPVLAQRVALLHAAEASHPELRRSAAEARVAAAKARSASVRRRPDLTVFANYNLVDDEGRAPMADGEDQWWVGVSLSVPLWGARYAAGERAAELQGTRAVLRRQAARERIEAELATTLATWEAAAEQVALYAGRLVPEAERALDAERASYAAGEGAFADLVGSARQVLDLRLELLRQEHRLGRLEAELLAAAGLVAADEIDEVDHD